MQAKTCKPRQTKAQSSMEYLTTYGWAILIVAVVAALLFALGLFGQSSSSAPSVCQPQPNFVCTDPIYTNNGISVSIGQNSGQDYYNAWGFITSSSEPFGSGGLPVDFSESNTVNMTPLGLLTPGQTVKLNYENSSDVKAGDIPVANVPVGNQFTGYVWIGYCTTIGCASPTNFAKVGAINVKEGGSAFSGGSPQNGPSSTSTSSTSTPTSTTTTSTSSTSTSTSTTTTSIYYVAIVLTNFQSSPTVIGFQQMLSVDSSNYNGANEIDPLWNNVEFSSGNTITNGGTPLQAWVESNPTNSGTTVVWVNLGAMQVPANGGTATIYMNFMPNSVMSASGPIGEAPQLSPTYAEYDDGTKVFNFYDNFAGQSLNATKWETSISSGGSVSVNNGLTIVADGSDTTIATQPGQIASSPSLYVELLGEVQFNGPEQDLHLNTPSGGAVASARDSPTFFTYTYCNGYTNGGSTTVSQDTLYLFSLYSDSGSSTTNIYMPSNYYVNYNSPTTTSSVGVGTSCFGDINSVVIQDGHTAIWIRTRAYPPSDVMPTANLGSVQ